MKLQRAKRVKKLQLKTSWFSIYDHETIEGTQCVLDKEVVGGRIVQGWSKIYLKMKKRLLTTANSKTMWILWMHKQFEMSPHFVIRVQNPCQCKEKKINICCFGDVFLYADRYIWRHPQWLCKYRTGLTAMLAAKVSHLVRPAWNDTNSQVLLCVNISLSFGPRVIDTQSREFQWD